MWGLGSTSHVCSSRWGGGCACSGHPCTQDRRQGPSRPAGEVPEGLAAGVVITKGQDRSLVVWPAAEFEQYAARIREASRSDARARSYSRVLFSSALTRFPTSRAGSTCRRHCATMPGSIATASLWVTTPPLDLGERGMGVPTSRTRSRSSQTCRKRWCPACSDSTSLVPVGPCPPVLGYFPLSQGPNEVSGHFPGPPTTVNLRAGTHGRERCHRTLGPTRSQG